MNAKSQYAGEKGTKMENATHNKDCICSRREDEREGSDAGATGKLIARRSAAACSLPLVTLTESTAPTESGTFMCETVNLSDDREVTVGHTEDGKRLIRIRRPEPDGGTCETKFGITEDAAFALGWLLAESFAKLPRKKENS